MTKEKLYLFDTTLRDGAQTRGVDFTVNNKRLIAKALDELGVDYVEGGWPGANPTDTAFFEDSPKLETAKFTAFGMTKRVGISADNDPVLAPLLKCDAAAICLVGKSWDFHVDVALGVPRGDNVTAIGESMEAIVARDKEALFDAEHFFDGYKANPEYALECVNAAFEGGARWVVLCDTNGGALPHEIEEIVSVVCDRFGGERIGIHTHNDTENAVGNTLMAVRAGARQVQGTINGLGERCGNANLMSLIPTFMLKDYYRDRFDIGIAEENLARITHISRMLDEAINRIPNAHQPYVGASAFAHKGGLHASAVIKDPTTYEHVVPETVGNQRIIPVSDQAGRSNILARIEDMGIKVDPKDPRISRLLDEIKEEQAIGYSYDGAEASFELKARRALGQLPEYFVVERYRVAVERRFDAKGKLRTVAEANVKVVVDGVEYKSYEEGNGPVNALDQALRKDLGKYSSYIEDMELLDYKVRILDGGTEAVTRVLIETQDSKTGENWFTVGVSGNIVDASFIALIDSVQYRLLRTKAPAAGK